MLRFLTSGESHGPGLVAILEGIPAGLSLTDEDINIELGRRQAGYGRGGRMLIEKDRVEILSGVRKGKTIASPISLLIRNKDWENWKDRISPVLTVPRPGHADLPGLLKYQFDDVRDVLERASARETAARVAVGAVCKKLLHYFGMNVFSRTLRIGTVKDTSSWNVSDKEWKAIEDSPVRCLDAKATNAMVRAIDKARADRDTLGGIIEVIARAVPVALGSYTQWDKRLDGRLAGALMSIQAIKSVEIGLGRLVGELPGSKVHDEIFYKKKKGFYRLSNNAGGVEGGISNGENITARIAMKPIATLMKPLSSVDFVTKKKTKALVERSDVCAVPAAGVIAENVMAYVVADAFCDKFGADSIFELQQRYALFQQQLRSKQ